MLWARAARWRSRPSSAATRAAARVALGAAEQFAPSTAATTSRESLRPRLGMTALRRPLPLRVARRPRRDGPPREIALLARRATRRTPTVRQPRRLAARSRTLRFRRPLRLSAAHGYVGSAVPMREPVVNETLQLGIVVRDLEATMRRYVDDYGIGPGRSTSSTPATRISANTASRSSAPGASPSPRSARCSGS
jgi:hypothetical protein